MQTSTHPKDAYLSSASRVSRKGFSTLSRQARAGTAQSTRDDTQNDGAGSGRFGAASCATGSRRRKCFDRAAAKDRGRTARLARGIIRTGSRNKHEKLLIQRFLERLPAHRVEDAMFRLMREFGNEEKARRMRVALIGLRGAGKSTLGSRLSQEMNIPFIELDREIEKDTGMPLAEIFSLYGQSGYRAIEKRCLERGAPRARARRYFLSAGAWSRKKKLTTICFRIATPSGSRRSRKNTWRA